MAREKDCVNAQKGEAYPERQPPLMGEMWSPQCQPMPGGGGGGNSSSSSHAQKGKRDDPQHNYGPYKGA